MTSPVTKHKAERMREQGQVRRAEAKVYLVRGRTKTYVTTVMCMNTKGKPTHGMPFTAFCNCNYGALRDAGMNAQDGCSHAIAALAEAYDDYTRERDAR